jgi:cyclopropane fatty-acyl-phospholipid synthase-like methyltransferase
MSPLSPAKSLFFLFADGWMVKFYAPRTKEVIQEPTHSTVCSSGAPLDTWKFYSIREKLHLYCNPLNKEEFETLLYVLRLKPNSKVLDIACGKGEFLVRLAELYRIKGVGVDISPYFTQEAQTKAKHRLQSAALAFIQLDAKNYKPPEDLLFELTSCMGATWIWNGYKGTLEALKDMTKPDGTIIIGEPYWLKTPDPEYLKIDNMRKETYADSHYDNIKTAEAEFASKIR